MADWPPCWNSLNRACVWRGREGEGGKGGVEKEKGEREEGGKDYIIIKPKLSIKDTIKQISARMRTTIQDL